MLQPFFDFIDKFATDFSWRRLIIFFSMILIIGFTYIIFENQTSTSELSKYERTVDILEKLSSIKTENEEIKKIVNNIYNGLDVITSKSSLSGLDISIKSEIKQAIAGGAMWLVFALFFIPGLLNKSNPDAGNIVGGCLAMAFIAGLGGYFLPITWSSWIVYGLYPVGFNLLLFALFAYLGNKE